MILLLIHLLNLQKYQFITKNLIAFLINTKYINLHLH